MFFELNEEDIFCQRTDPNFNTLLRSGGGGLFHPRRPGERTITNEKEETTTTTTTTPARERFLSRAVSPSTPRSAKTLESATLCAVDNERRRTNESIPRTFFVFNKTTLTRRKEENGAGRGVSSSSSSSRKRARDPSPLSRSWNRVRKTALLVPSPSIDGVAECGVLCFVSRFLFLEKPKQKKGVDIFSQKEEDVQKKKVKKNQTIFCCAKILQKRGKVPKRSTLSTKPRG